MSYTVDELANSYLGQVRAGHIATAVENVVDALTEKELNPEFISRLVVAMFEGVVK